MKNLNHLLLNLLMLLLAFLVLAPQASAFSPNAFTAFVHADQAPTSAFDERIYIGSNVFDLGADDLAGLNLRFDFSNNLDPLTNLGTLSWTVTNTGASALTHIRFLVLLDAFIAPANDSADATGLGLRTGCTDFKADSFEIGNSASIPFLSHLFAGTLSNTNAFAGGLIGNVAIALGFNIETLRPGEKFQVVFGISNQNNAGLRLFAGSEQVFFNVVDVPTGPFPCNNAPNFSSNPSPADGTIGVSTTPILSWVGSDPDPGDTVTYDVFFGSSSSPPLVSSGQSTTSFSPGALERATTYFWQIVARDNHGTEAGGPVWRFTTGFPPGISGPAPPPPTTSTTTTIAPETTTTTLTTTTTAPVTNTTAAIVVPPPGVEFHEPVLDLKASSSTEMNPGGEIVRTVETLAKTPGIILLRQKSDGIIEMTLPGLPEGSILSMMPMGKLETALLPEPKIEMDENKGTVVITTPGKLILGISVGFKIELTPAPLSFSDFRDVLRKAGVAIIKIEMFPGRIEVTGSIKGSGFIVSLRPDFVVTQTQETPGVRLDNQGNLVINYEGRRQQVFSILSLRVL